MEKRRFESFKVFSCLKKINPRILSTFKRSFSKKMVKKPSSHIIHSLGGEYCRIVRDSEPIRLLKSPRSSSVYILKECRPWKIVVYLLKEKYDLWGSITCSVIGKQEIQTKKVYWFLLTALLSIIPVAKSSKESSS